MSNKVGIRANKIDKRQKEALHNDKRINPLGSHHDPKSVRTKQQSPKVHEAKPDRTERRNNHVCNYSWGPSTPPTQQGIKLLETKPTRI